MALRSHGLAKFILKHDDGESDDEGEDVDGDGIADDELVEVGHVLWTHHSLIYKAFDSYASIGASGGSAGDMTRISVSGFKQFCHDCKIVVKGSASCSQAHLDQLFVLVNQNRPSDKHTEAVDDVVIRGVRGSATTVVEVDENTRALNRQEWLNAS